ncbi:GerAB/ArcD/ProY family transporter [Salinithrix halophila]|uniref:GerAB/ArcD/ProY family transporter n=1 Tax=Salinithrix halophila TaxID=1485204 RepID=A0ABV8J9F9_9BACL
MEKVKISPYQLFTLIVLFELGSALVVALGVTAKKDAWLAILMGLVLGLAVFLVNNALYRSYPDQPLTGYVRKIWGPYIGWVVGLAYVWYFTYIASRVLRDFIDLLITLYDLTPEFVLGTGLMVVMIYTLYLGIEVLARLGELFIVVMISLGFIASLFLWMTETVQIERLLPVLENGWKPVLMTVFPQTLTVPFGEMIVFSMIFPYLNRPKKALPIGLMGMAFSGLILTYTISLNIAVLGVDIMGRSPFPLLGTVGKITVANILQNLNVIALLTLIIGGFFKISIFFYAAVLGVTDLFRMKDTQQMVVPLGLVILFFSIAIASDFSLHIEEGLKVVPLYLHLPFQIGIPILLFLTNLFRKRRNKRKTRSAAG